MLGLAGSGRAGGLGARVALTLSLENGRTIASGRLTDGSAPIAGRAVSVFLEGVRAGNANSGADGTWRVDLGELGSGEHRIEATAETTLRSGPRLFHVALTRRLAATNKVFALGDSRTLDNMRSGGLTTVGPMVWARQLSLGRITYGKASNNGVGGATTAQIRANQFAQALASDASVLVLLGGVNDANVGSITAAQTLGHLAYMAETFVASDPGRVCLLLDELPVSNLQDGARHLAVRDGIRAMDDPDNGICVVPSWNALAAVPDGAAPQPFAYRDGIHMAKRGAFAVGREIWAVLQRVTRSFDLLAQGGVLAGGNFVTSGAGPNGWVVPSGTGIATRMEEASGLNWLVMTFTEVTGLQAAAYASATAIPAGLTPGQNFAEAAIRYRLDAESQNLSYVGMELRRQSGQRLPAAGGEPAVDGFDMGSTFEGVSGMLPPDAIDGLLRPPPGDLTGATQLRPFWITVRGLPNQPASGTVRIALPQLRAA